MDDEGLPGCLLIIGGAVRADDAGPRSGRSSAARTAGAGRAADRCYGTGVLEQFAELCGGSKARVVVITAATGTPGETLAEYEQVFRKLGIKHVRELAIRGRADADSQETAAVVDQATGVFFSGGDQSRLQALVGSKVNEQLAARLAQGLVIAGTSAGATALGRTMILGGNGAEVSTATVRTGPGLGLTPRLLIDMHFGERGRLPRLLSAVTLDPDRLGVGIDENTAICVRGDTFDVLGSGVASVVDAQRATVVHAASDCDPITLFDVRLHLLPAGCMFDIAGRAPAIGPAHARY